MRIYTPDNLKYPVTVKKLLRNPGDEVLLNAALFVYEYKSLSSEYDEFQRDFVDKERIWPTNFESELEGTLTSLDVQEGQVLTRRTKVADIEEACRHEVQFGGLCANCGKDMNEVHSYNESTAMTSRATINTIHGHTKLLVSADEATKADEEAKRRLLDTRRLSLVVDLDQTIIHASVDPTIQEWMNDPSNPNHEAVKNVCKFQLVDDIPGRPGTWYYIKMRPGLRDFLQNMSRYYEMHIYTMGTRAYAQHIAKIIDPESKLFGDRILSRDESGSMTAKNLNRLFPVDTKMVVIIDDRADVWDWSPNLIKVNVYEFFVGIGDINGAYLPPRPELDGSKGGAKMERTPSKKNIQDVKPDEAKPEETKLVENATPESSGPLNNPLQTNGESSTVEKIVSMAGKQDAKSIKSQEEEQEQTITSQLEERPLLQKQKMLEAMEEEEAKASPAVEATSELLSGNAEKNDESSLDTPPKQKYRHNLLVDDDTELEYLGRNLRSIHEAYYEEYDRDAVGTKGSRVAELRPGHTQKRSVDEFDRIPDAATLMDELKSKVLSGVHIVFSGVVPLGVDHQTHDTALWAKSFGAKVSQNITKRTTHLIASPERRTAKVRQAVKRGGRVAVVSQKWLYACFSQWKRVDEQPFRIHTDAPTNGNAGLPDSFDQQDYPLSASDEEAAKTEDETDGIETPNGNANGLALDTDLDTDNEDWEKHKPSLSYDDSSPAETEYDWSQINAELDEFCSDLEDSESDTESVLSDLSGAPADPPSSHRKRKSAELDSDDEIDGSKRKKRKKQGINRTSSLTNMTAAAPESLTSIASDNGADEGDDGDATDLDLEAALAAEMERQSDDGEEEEEGEGGEEGEEGEGEEEAAAETYSRTNALNG